MKPAWIAIAEKEIGVHEVRGGEAPRILEYHSKTSLHAKEDEIPWCSAFVNWVMDKAGYKRTDSAAARSWVHYGQKLEHYEPYCIVVFRRGTGLQGHVGFAVADEGQMLKVLAGNQSDSVCYAHLPKARVIAYVWPREQDKLGRVEVAKS